MEIPSAHSIAGTMEILRGSNQRRVSFDQDDDNETLFGIESAFQNGESNYVDQNLRKLLFAFDQQSAVVDHLDTPEAEPLQPSNDAHEVRINRKRQKKVNIKTKNTRGQNRKRVKLSPIPKPTEESLSILQQASALESKGTSADSNGTSFSDNDKQLLAAMDQLVQQHRKVSSHYVQLTVAPGSMPHYPIFPIEQQIYHRHLFFRCSTKLRK